MKQATRRVKREARRTKQEARRTKQETRRVTAKLTLKRKRPRKRAAREAEGRAERRPLTMLLKVTEHSALCENGDQKFIASSPQHPVEFQVPRQII